MKLRALIADVRSKRRYFHDPLLLFGILWAALTLFSIVQSLADFDLGLYVKITITEYRKLSALLARFITLPLQIQLPQALADGVTAWVLLAGVTARAQQIKFQIAQDELVEGQALDPEDNLYVDATCAATTHTMLGRLKTLCVPMNLALWPFIAFSEISGVTSTYQIFKPKLLYEHLFGQGIHPDMRAAFGGTARSIFILQWVYIFVSLAGFFLINALNVYIDKPGIL